MSTWDIAWRIAFFVIVAAAGLVVVELTEREAAEKFDTDWSDR